MSDILLLCLCAVLFVGSHFLLSSIPVRSKLLAVLDVALYMQLYSVTAFGTMAGMVWFWIKAPRIDLWVSDRSMAWLPLIAMPFAFLLLVESLTRINPTAIFQGEKMVEGPPRGLFAITRHPGMWGFALWAVTHMVVNGDVASQIMMAAVLVLALGGSLHIDARRKLRLGEQWDGYAAHTSWLPFAAILQGRAKLELSDIGLWRVVLALVIYGLMLLVHATVITASPFPWSGHPL